MSMSDRLKHKPTVQIVMDKARSFRSAHDLDYDRIYKEMEQFVYSALEEQDKEQMKLRVLLAASRAPNLYRDDGELSDSSVHPFIDYKRDTADEIGAKLMQRGLDKLKATADSCEFWLNNGGQVLPLSEKPDDSKTEY